MSPLPGLMPAESRLSTSHLQLLAYSYLVYGITAQGFWRALARHVASSADTFSNEGLALLLWAHARAAALAPKPSGGSASYLSKKQQYGWGDNGGPDPAAAKADAAAMYAAAGNVLAGREATWRATYGKQTMAEQLGRGHVPVFG